MSASASILSAVLMAFGSPRATVPKANLQHPTADLMGLALPPPAAAADPLFAQMAGTWAGEGERQQLISGRRTRIQAQVDSRIAGDRLISRNQVTEVAIDSAGNPAGEPKVYQRVYWLRPKADQPGAYELGYGTGEDAAVTSIGTFQGSVFETEQALGGGMSIRSQTEFSADGSIYTETGWHDGTELFETHIRYRH